MKSKAVKDLLPGETFVDSLGMELKVLLVKPLPFLGIPGTKPWATLMFETPSGNKMVQNFRADRIVEVK